MLKRKKQKGIIPHHRWKIFSDFSFSTVFFSFPVILLVLYWPSFSAGFFCWDDQEVALSPLVRQACFRNIFGIFTTFHAGLYHPLTTLSLIVDYHTGNGAAFPYHLTNLIIHILNVCLVYLFIKRLTDNNLIPFLVALIFAVHPLQVEPVTWITSRKDLLYTLFLILALIFYISYLKNNLQKKYLIPALVFFLFSCLSKIQAMSLPFLLFVLDGHFKRRFTPGMIAEKIPFFILLCIFVMLNIKAQDAAGYTKIQAFVSVDRGILASIYGMFLYIQKTLIPYPLSVFYPLPADSHIPNLVYYFFSPLTVLTLLLGTAWLFYRNPSKESTGLLIFLISMLPLLVVTGHREFIIANRYLYFASAGIFFYILTTAQRFAKRIVAAQWIFYFGTTLAILIFFLLTRNEIQRWTSPETLFRSSLRIYPGDPVLLAGLGDILIKEDKNEEALEYLDAAIQTGRKNLFAVYNRGVAEYNLRLFEQAEKDFTTTVTLRPDYPDGWFALGNVARLKGKQELAANYFSRVISLDGSHWAAWQNRAIVRGNIGDLRGALDDLGRTIEINPECASAFYLRGLVKFDLGLDGCPDLRTASVLGLPEASTILHDQCGE